MANAPMPTEEHCAVLNREFFDAQPWLYFQQRLAHLVLASDVDRYREIFGAGVEAGGVRLKIEANPDPNVVSTAEQSFTAVETEVFLHHSAETLLRFVHAFAEPSPCPWIRLTSLTSAREFKRWVEATIADAPREDLAALSRRVFAVDPTREDDVASHVRYLRLFAKHFLDADSYNAAKHGMALRGASERMRFDIDEWKAFERQGPSVSWLAQWPRGDNERPTRWTQVTRLLDLDTAVALIYTATLLIRGAWVRGRAEHLDEEWTHVFRPVPLEELLDDRGLRHHVLADLYRPMAYEGESGAVIIKTAHLDAPPESMTEAGGDIGSEDQTRAPDEPT